MRFCDPLEHKEQPIALRQPFFDTPPTGVNNSAPSASRPESTNKSGKAVQTNGATYLGPTST